MSFERVIIRSPIRFKYLIIAPFEKGEPLTPRQSKKPLFTVGIPAYNTEDFLNECLNSVAQQTFRDFELIVIDDGSQDATGIILDKFSQRHPFATVLHKSNQGPLLARRAIVDIATGEYIIFLDADDRLRRDALEICAKEISDASPDILAFDYSIDPNFSHPIPGIKLSPGHYLGAEFCKVKESACQGKMNQLCFKAIRLALFDKEADYSSYAGLKHSEDLFQILPVINKAESLLYIGKCLYFYRQSQQNGTSHYAKSQRDDLRVTSDRLEQYGERWNMQDAAREGIIMQYCYLLKILVADSTLTTENRNDEFQAIRRSIIERIGDRDLLKSFNLPLRILLGAIIAGRTRFVELLLAAEKTGQVLSKYSRSSCN